MAPFQRPFNSAKESCIVSAACNEAKHKQVHLTPCLLCCLVISAQSPTHPPHITALSLTPPTPWKTLHALTYTATWPKYTAPLSLLLSACSDTLYALTTTGFPPCHKKLTCVCVCVCKYFACAPDSISFFPLPAERHQSFLWLLQLAFQFVGHKCQGGQWCGWIQRVPKEGRKQRKRPRGHCLEIRYQRRAWPCQHQLTLSYRDTQTATGRLCLNSGSKRWTSQTAAVTAALPLCGPQHR